MDAKLRLLPTTVNKTEQEFYLLWLEIYSMGKKHYLPPGVPWIVSLAAKKVHSEREANRQFNTLEMWRITGREAPVGGGK